MKRTITVATLAAAVLLAACQTKPAAPTMTPTTGVWISAKEIAALPTSGAGWSDVHAAATKAWGAPTIADQNSDDDTDTLAGALVAVRLNDSNLKTKVRNHLMELASNHPYDRVLSLARQLPSYVIAADVVGRDTNQRASFSAFLREAITHDMDGHSGGTDLVSTALLSPNNWGTMSRAAMAAVDVYLGDKAGLAKIADTQEAWLGGAAPNTLKYSTTNWHQGAGLKVSANAGINPRGASRDGHSLDGVIPEDQRRTGEYTWPAPRGSYPHEALQGAVVASVILDRAGVLAFDAGDHALERAERWLSVTNGNPPTSEDANTPWLLTKYGSSTFARTADAGEAKNIAWASWTAA